MKWTRVVWPSKLTYRFIASGLAALTMLSAVLILADHFFRTEEPVAPTLQDGRAVAVGTNHSDSFKNISPITDPFFSVCPITTKTWKVGFRWVVLVRGDPISFIRTAPPVFVATPPDLFDLRSEEVVNIFASGSVKRTHDELSTVQDMGSTNPRYDVITVKPKRVMQVGKQLQAYYGVKFKTNRMSVGRYGLGARGFNLSYFPQLMSDNDWNPGFGKTATPEPGGGSALKFLSCQSPFMKNYYFKQEEFFPAPSEVRPRQSFAWALTVDEGYTITGVLYGGPERTLQKASGWFLTNSLAGLLGMLYGVAVGQSNGKMHETRTKGSKVEPTPTSRATATEPPNQRPKPQVTRKGRKKRGRRS